MINVKNAVRKVIQRLTHNQNTENRVVYMLNDDNTVRKIIQLLIDNQDTEIKRIRFPIDGTENETILSFVPTDRKEEKWEYSVAVKRSGTDVLVNHFLKFGSKSEVLAYMRSEKAVTETMSSIKKLNEYTNEHN